MTITIQVRDNEGGDSTIDVPATATSGEIRQAVIDHVASGDYGDVESTVWVDAHYGLETADEWDGRVTVSIDPDEPSCVHDEGHEWRSPHSLVGGIAENPGVWGNGGGVICTEVCVRCGLQKTTDSWAQRPDTGEQGLESISYQTDEDHDVSYWIMDALDDTLRAAGYDSEVIGNRGSRCTVHVSVKDDLDADAMGEIADKIDALASVGWGSDGLSGLAAPTCNRQYGSDPVIVVTT